MRECKELLLRTSLSHMNAQDLLHYFQYEVCPANWSKRFRVTKIRFIRFQNEGHFCSLSCPLCHLSSSRRGLKSFLNAFSYFRTYLFCHSPVSFFIYLPNIGVPYMLQTDKTSLTSATSLHNRNASVICSIPLQNFLKLFRFTSLMALLY